MDWIDVVQVYDTWPARYWLYVMREITLMEVVPSQEGMCPMEWVIVS
jgi:hypothetical protein